MVELIYFSAHTKEVKIIRERFLWIHDDNPSGSTVEKARMTESTARLKPEGRQDLFVATHKMPNFILIQTISC
jgi:hypothetical protein